MLSWEFDGGTPPIYTAGGKYSVRPAPGTSGTWESYFGKLLLGRLSSVIDAVDVCERIAAHKKFEKAVIDADKQI